MTEKDELPVAPVKVSKRQTSKPNFKKGEEATLHESSQIRITAFPGFVSRTAGDQLTLKICHYNKNNLDFYGNPIVEKSISLNGKAVERLAELVAANSKIVGEEREGEFTVFQTMDPNGGGWKLSPKLPELLDSLSSEPELVELLLSSDQLQDMASKIRFGLRIAEMRAATDELEGLLSSGVNEESHYQEWCEKHAWAFGNAYFSPDDVRAISAGDKVDILLPTSLASYRDIIELKRPDKEVLRFDSAHKSYYFSSDVSQAIGQCHRYLDQLHEKAAKGLDDHEEIVAYHPKAIIVIGQSSNWSGDKLKALHGLNARMHTIQVMTYDQLLAQSEQLISSLDIQSSEAEVPF